MTTTFIKSVIITSFLALMQLFTYAQSWNTNGNSGTNPATNFIGTTDSKAFKIRTNNATRITITNGGNVGIGITNPSAKLDVHSTSGTRGGNFYLNTSTSGNVSGINSSAINNAMSGGATGGSFNASASGGLSSSTGLNSYAQGGHNNYGILSGVLSANGQAGYGVYGSSSGPGGDWGGYFTSDDIGVEAIANSTYGIGGKFNGTSRGVYAMGRIAGDFNGTQALNITSTTNLNNVPFGYSYGIESNMDNPANFDAIGISSYVAGHLGANVVAVYGEATQSAGGSGVLFAMYGVGNIGATGDIGQASDRKLKRDIAPLTNMMDKIMLLHPSSYNFRTDEYKMGLPEGKHFGVIAQELQQVFPELVSRQVKPGRTDDKTGQKISETVEYLGVNYIGLIPIAIGGIQEHQKAIEELRKENEALKAEIAEIKNAASIYNNIASAKKSNTTDLQAGLKNNPNPFSDKTTVECFIPANVMQSEIKIYDTNGKEIKSIAVSQKGIVMVEITADGLANGTYIYQLVADGKTISTNKMTVLK
ncbi:MAG: tail fiber domain-containing protein [Bacteroidia bacterium]